MATVFTRIIQGELPGRFVWRDERCVGFLSINPLRHGHALVVPIEEVDHWLDLEPSLNAHLMEVSQRIGQAQMAALSPTRIGLMIAGLEVPHVHLHVVPIDGVHDMDFANATRDPDPAAMDQARDDLVAALRAAGHEPGVS
jgi:histidine triad (HIT) family protein